MHGAWLQQIEEEERKNATVIQISTTGAETSVTLVQQDPPADHTNADTPSPAVPVTEPVQAPQSAESSLDAFFDVRASVLSSPTLSTSTVSDLAPTVSSEDTGVASNERINARHDTFYFEDGNVEIVCGETVFRVHSAILSFASSNLGDILSGLLRFRPQIPGGCPRVTFDDSAEDFAMLLRMIYTPGWVSLPSKAL